MDRRISLILLIIGICLSIYLGLGLVQQCYSQDFIEEWIDLGFARYRLASNSEHLLLIDTQQGLTNDKELRARNEGEVKKNCPPNVEKMYGQLMKLDDIQAIVITYRRIEIAKYPFKTDWKTMLEQIEKILTDNLNQPSG